MPEALWSVGLDDDIIWVIDADGNRSAAPLADLGAIVIETNDSGPWGADLWWIFDEPDGAMASFPEGATGEQEVIDYLMTLPGFDFDKHGQAVRSTENASFVVWKLKESRQ